MFKKLREKITEEVQQTSLRLPVSVQQSVQQLTQTPSTDQWLESVREGSQLSLSPFSGAGSSPGEQKRDLPPDSLQDELLVDISDIRPAGHNKDLFSIDEDSHEGSPSKSGFQLVDLSDAEAVALTDPGGGNLGPSQGVAGVTFDPTMAISSPRTRRDSAGSSVSDASGLFPIYEVPGVSFNMPQSDLESSSEWEDGGGGGVGGPAVDRLSKDTVYQAYLKMRGRYHKYKGRYADLARAYKEKEKESDKLRDVLTKTQDKALRKVKILQEGVEGDSSSTTPAAPYNNNNNNNSEVPLAAAATTLVVGDDTDGNQASDNSSGADNMSTSECVSTGESVSTGDNTSMADNMSVASHGSTSTAITASHEAEELIEKLRGDVAKHKSLLARCMENIRGNKERIATLTQERDLATSQLQEKIRQIEIIKEEHVKELDSLRSSVESSALSMAETKKQLFEELQAKEAETERWRGESKALEQQMEGERTSWQDQLQNTLQLLQEKETLLQELMINEITQEETKEEQAEDEEKEEDEDEEDRKVSVAAIRKEVEIKMSQLEARTLELKDSRTQLEMQLADIGQTKVQLEKEKEQLGTELEKVKKELEEVQRDNEEARKKLEEVQKCKEEAQQGREEAEMKLLEIDKARKGMEAQSESLEEQFNKLQDKNQQLEEKLEEMERSRQEMEKQIQESGDIKKQLDKKLEESERERQHLGKQIEESTELQRQIEKKLGERESEKQDLEKEVEELKQTHLASNDQAIFLSQEILLLKETNSTLTHNLEVCQREISELKGSIEKVEREEEELLRNLSEKCTSIKELEIKCADYDEMLKTNIDEKSKFGKELMLVMNEKDTLSNHIKEMKKENDALTEKIKGLNIEKEEIARKVCQLKEEQENENQRLISLGQENESLKAEKDRLNSELVSSQENVRIGNERASTELSNITEKMDQINNRWAAQMNEKDKLNEELCREVSDLDDNLKMKAEEYNQKIESLNNNLKEREDKEREQAAEIDSLCTQLQEMDSKEKYSRVQIDNFSSKSKEREEKEKELVVQMNSLTEENQKLTKVLVEIKRDLQIKEADFIRIQDDMERESKKVSIRVAKLEADLNTREAELTSLVEERTNLTTLQDTLNSEKAKLAEELTLASDEVSGFKEKLSKSENDAKEKEMNCTKLMEEASRREEEYRKTKEQMAKLSETFENEMTKAKNSYSKLRESFQTMSQEKEGSLADQITKITELENRDTENCKQLSELNSTLSLKEEKIEKLLEEKKLMLAELENKVEELQEGLDEKEKLLRTATMKFDIKIEELEAQMSSNEETMRQQLENSLKETHMLEAKVAELSHSVLEKDELLVRQAEEGEQKLMETQEDFAKEVKELENTWEQRLRCELDRLQKQHEENLASSNWEVTSSEQSQLVVAGSSHQRAVATRDATIAALKDEADRLHLAHEEELDTWRNKYKLLESNLAETQCQAVCQSDWLKVIEASMEQSSVESAETGPQEGPGPGPDPGIGEQPRMEERLRAAHTTCKALTAKVDQLLQLNQQLTQHVEEHKQEKEGTAKTIAMLEFNIEHNKSKVRNMELSHLDLKNKIDALVGEKERLVRQLREGSSSGLYDELTNEKEELGQRLTQEKDDLERRLTRDKNNLEERLMREKEEMEEGYQKQQTAFQEQLNGLMEIKEGYEKQIRQIEANNAEMHDKIGAVQLERDAARSEAKEFSAQKSEIERKLEEITQVKEGLEQQIVAQRGVIATLEDTLNGKEGEIQTMTEATSTLQNNILNLQKQVEGLNETCGKLARDLEAESKLRIDTQAQLAQARQAHKQLEEKQGASGTNTDDVARERRELETSVAALSEVRLKCAEFEAQVSMLETDKRTLMERLTKQTDPPSDTSVDVVVEHLTEKTLTNAPQRNTDESDDVMRFRALMKEKDVELSQTKQTLMDIQERLRVAEVVSGEIEEQRAKVQATEARLAEAERKYQAQVMKVEADAERRVADTQQLCHQTISTAFDQQDTETSELVRQQQEVLKEAQARTREKATQLESVVNEYEEKLKEKDEELCKFVQQYEDQLASLRLQHESQVKEIEAAWQAKAEKMARQRETNKQEEMDGLSQEWNKERRELERLTQVAAAAFRSGTESVELLKKQVATQRRELEDVKLNHVKEMGELKALLELKRRTRSGGSGGVRLGVALEEAAEFEYLKNILYQYMLGKETQTLSKVLCAVVKFDPQQQQEILDHEDQRQSMMKPVNGTIETELLECERSDHSKTL